VSDPKAPGAIPPDLPPEYVEAYRRGYERAYRQATGQDPEFPDATERAKPVEPIEPVEDSEPIEATAVLQRPVVPEPTQARHATEPTQEAEEDWPGPRFPLFVDEPHEPHEHTTSGRHSAEPPAEEHDVLPLDHDAYYDDEPRRRPAWLVPALLAAAVVVLLLGAYGVGRMFSSSVSNADTGASEEPTDGVAMNEDGSTDVAGGEKPHKKPQGKKYVGEVTSAPIGGASASCESDPGVDSAGNEVSYRPDNVYDGDASTAWRCDGDGGGEKLTLELPGPTKIGEVGLVPEYAKTDPRSGVDRYRENNRITKVRWVFSDGTAVVQKLDPSVENRSMQTMRIPVTSSDQVVVEILGSKHGPRNTIAVSEVRLGQAAN